MNAALLLPMLAVFAAGVALLVVGLCRAAADADRDSIEAFDKWQAELRHPTRKADR